MSNLVIFLDIDGVLNNSDTKDEIDIEVGSHIGMNEILVNRLKRIIEATNCSVVLSSTWKYWPMASKIVKERVCDFIDMTPNIGEFRGREVKAWLESQTVVVDRYAILDDNNDFYPDQLLFLFRTDSSLGLTDEIADKVIAYLGDEEIIEKEES